MANSCVSPVRFPFYSVEKKTTNGIPFIALFSPIREKLKCTMAISPFLMLTEFNYGRMRIMRELNPKTLRGGQPSVAYRC